MSAVSEENLVLCNAPLVGGALEITGAQLKAIVDATADAGFGGASLWAFHHMAAIADGAIVLDIREPDEYEEGALANAIHIPRGHLEAQIESRIIAE